MKQSKPVALFTTPDWAELVALFEAHGTAGHEMRCQKIDGVWCGQVYAVSTGVQSPTCYQCEGPVGYLFADGRGACCTRLTPEEVGP